MATFIVQPLNGLGNRLQVYISARRYATLRGHRLVWYEPDGYLSRYYRLEVDDVCDHLPDAPVIDSLFLKRGKFRGLKGEVTVMRTWACVTERPRQLHLPMLVPFVPSLSESFREAVTAKAAELGLDTCVGVHVRWSDNHIVRLSNNFESVIGAVSSLVAAGRRVFSATDSQSMEARLVAAGASPTGNVYQRGITWRRRGRRRITHSSAQERIAVFTMHLLAACGARILSSESSYSRMAHLFALARQNDRSVFAGMKTAEQILSALLPLS